MGISRSFDASWAVLRLKASEWFNLKYKDWTEVDWANLLKKELTKYSEDFEMQDTWHIQREV